VARILLRTKVSAEPKEASEPVSGCSQPILSSLVVDNSIQPNAKITGDLLPTFP
jgi:hypothetical protein